MTTTHSDNPLLVDNSLSFMKLLPLEQHQGVTMSLLHPARPLIVNPVLAQKIGLNEAIILQQIDYWLRRSTSVEHQGKKWVYNSIAAWAKQFPFLSQSTIKRTIRSLERLGLLISANYNRDQRDKTKWYTINFAKLAELENQPVNHATEPLSPVQQVKMNSAQQLKLTQALPKSTYKSNSEINLAMLSPEVLQQHPISQFDLALFTQQPSRAIWQDFLCHRKNIRAPLTQSAINRLAKQINLANQQGYSTDEVLAIIQLQGWRGFELNWLQRKQLKPALLSCKKFDGGVDVSGVLADYDNGVIL